MNYFFILLGIMNYMFMPLLAQNMVISQGHSHNDYNRDRPLLDALEGGMSSIEIDIILVEGTVIVSHDEDHYNLNHTIENLYFTPIKKLLTKRGGTLYSDGARSQIQLLIDLKTKGSEILLALDKIVKKDKILFDRRGQDKKWSPFQIVLSGEVDKQAILGQENFEYFHVDGRCPDVKKKYPSHEMPLISENYTKHFKWNGEGSPKKKEIKKLQKLVKEVHKQGKKLRFWATQDNEAVWAYLLEQGVDYINVDDLPKFQKFMNEQ